MLQSSIIIYIHSTPQYYIMLTLHNFILNIKNKCYHPHICTLPGCLTKISQKRAVKKQALLRAVKYIRKQLQKYDVVVTMVTPHICIYAQSAVKKLVHLRAVKYIWKQQQRQVKVIFIFLTLIQFLLHNFSSYINYFGF